MITAFVFKGEQCFQLSLCIHVVEKIIVGACSCSQCNGSERNSEKCFLNVIISGKRNKTSSDSGEMFILKNKQNMLILCVVGSICMQSVLRDGQGLPYCLVLE